MSDDETEMFISNMIERAIAARQARDPRVSSEMLRRRVATRLAILGEVIEGPGDGLTATIAVIVDAVCS